jgi:hypothetical protein
VTPVRHASCRKLLHGIELLEVRIVRDIGSLSGRCNTLQNEIRSLTEQIGHSNYADIRLLQPMSRRIGSAAKHLEVSRQELVKAQKKRLKLLHTKQILQNRINLYLAERAELELLEQVSEFLSGKAAVQPATRNSR